MALASVLMLWPIRFADSAYQLRVTLHGVTENLAFPATGSLTQGRNYWVSGDGQADADGGVGGVGDLLGMLAATLDSHSQTGTFTCSLTSDLLVEIETANHADTFSILWGSTDTTLDEGIFGFPNSSTSSSFRAVGTLLPKGMWRTERPPTEDSRDRQPIVASVGVAISGVQRISRLAAPKKTRELLFALMPAAKALTEYAPADAPFGTFETMLTDSLSFGRPIRCYDDETARTLADYGLYAAQEIDPIKQLARESVLNILWRASLKLRRAD